MRHYFTNDDDLKDDGKLLKFVLRGNELCFYTNSGVFSKTSVDFGSQVLIKNFTFSGTDGPILDIGCGYGPIGLSLAKGTSEVVHMIDVNEKALSLAKRNAEVNLINNVMVYYSDALEGVDETFSSVVTNPPIRAGKSVIHKMVDKAYERLKFNGEFWAVVQKKQGAPSFREKVEAVFGNSEIVVREKGYYIIFAKRVD